MMKHLVDPSQMTSLSGRARTKLNDWLLEKGYGMKMEDGEFFPTTQLSMSQLVDFLDEYDLSGKSVTDSFKRGKIYVDELFKRAKQILEETN